MQYKDFAQVVNHKIDLRMISLYRGRCTINFVVQEIAHHSDRPQCGHVPLIGGRQRLRWRSGPRWTGRRGPRKPLPWRIAAWSTRPTLGAGAGYVAFVGRVLDVGGRTTGGHHRVGLGHHGANGPRPVWTGRAHVVAEATQERLHGFPLGVLARVVGVPVLAMGSKVNRMWQFYHSAMGTPGGLLEWLAEIGPIQKGCQTWRAARPTGIGNAACTTSASAHPTTTPRARADGQGHTATAKGGISSRDLASVPRFTPASLAAG